MKAVIFKKFVCIVTFFYEQIFHEKMSDEVRKFFKNLSYVAFGTIIGTIFSFTFNILAGRILGPSGYGEFTLVRSVAMFLYIPMTLGVGTAMVKYNAEKKEDFERQSEIISTTFILASFFTISTLILYSLFSSQLSRIFSISNEIFYLSVIFTLLFVIYTLTTKTLMGLHRMKIHAILQPIFSFILLSSFLFFIFNNLISFRSAVFSMCIAYGLIGGSILIILRRYIKFEFNRRWADKLVGYGKYALIGGVSFVFYTNIDRILINKYLTVVDVGVYGAYYYASMGISGLFLGIFNTVFFPIASKYEDKEGIFKKINRSIPYLIGLGLPLIILSEFVILKLYGGEYPIDLSLMLLFAIVSILIVCYGLYDWTFCSEGVTGVKLVTIATVVIAIIDITLNIYLIPHFGLFGAITSTAIAFFVGICCLLLFKRRIS